MKVIEKVKESSSSNVVFSFEYCPPRPGEDVEKLLEKMKRMVAHGPAFCDITWGAGGSRPERTLKTAERMQNEVGVETMMHLTCLNTTVNKIDESLEIIKAAGLRNVLALRGDPPRGQDERVQLQGAFACARDLVKHIREKHQDYFGIAVAGYPEAHPSVIGDDGVASDEAYQRDLVYLKSKVDAGADFIVTQLFYDADIFFKFVDDCRQIGITCPIVPGILPINTYKGFMRMTALCKTKIPDEIHTALNSIKENDALVRAYGIHLGTEMCRKILNHGISTLHLYTLNTEISTITILTNLGLIEDRKITRSLPSRRIHDSRDASSTELSDHQAPDPEEQPEDHLKSGRVEEQPRSD